MEVIDLGGRRELLVDWEEIRRHILRGRLGGGAVFVCTDPKDGPVVHLFGTFKDDPQAALRAATLATIELTRQTNRPPIPDLKASQ